jgi:hypothetical protein
LLQSQKFLRRKTAGEVSTALIIAHTVKRVRGAVNRGQNAWKP